VASEGGGGGINTDSAASHGLPAHLLVAWRVVPPDNIASDTSPVWKSVGESAGLRSETSKT
jgi:hypothetical protein